MKNLLLMAGLMLSTQVAFAQRSAEYCTHVDMIDTRNPGMVLASYQNRLNDDCYEARKQCRLDTARLANRDCVKVYAYSNPPRPNPIQTPVPTPGPDYGRLELPRLGDQVIVDGHNYNSRVERQTLQGAFEVRNQNTGTLFIQYPEELGVTQGCLPHAIADVCVGDQVIARGHNYNSRVEGPFRNGRVAFRNTNTGDRFFEQAYGLAVTTGCINVYPRTRLCVGDRVRAVGHNYMSVVEGLFENEEVVIRNTNTGDRFIFSVNSLQ